ncbi:MAG: hypothetical protein K1X67_20120 [Fimbriimonadaceae bacterium]|nr:hypothetical protein [Fimbriimonadaceae bacterium]
MKVKRAATAVQLCMTLQSILPEDVETDSVREELETRLTKLDEAEALLFSMAGRVSASFFHDGQQRIAKLRKRTKNDLLLVDEAMLRRDQMAIELLEQAAQKPVGNCSWELWTPAL